MKIPYFSRASETTGVESISSIRARMEQSVYERNSMSSMISVMPKQVPEDALWQRWKGAVSGEVGGCLPFCLMGFSTCCPFLRIFEVCGHMILIYKLVEVVNTHGENQQIWWLISKNTYFFSRKLVGFE